MRFSPLLLFIMHFPSFSYFPSEHCFSISLTCTFHLFLFITLNDGFHRNLFITWHSVLYDFSLHIYLPIFTLKQTHGHFSRNFIPKIHIVIHGIDIFYNMILPCCLKMLHGEAETRPIKTFPQIFRTRTEYQSAPLSLYSHVSTK